MSHQLLVTVRMHDGRYHGMGEWLPSPARLFQALVAGAARGGALDDSNGAFHWLEGLAPPVIAFPRMHTGRRVSTFVPDNDLDAVCGEVGRVGEIRSSKVIEPKFFDVAIPFLYAWAFEGGNEGTQRAGAVCGLADKLYQLGRGVDMAWALGEVLDDETLASRLSDYPGVIYRPSANGSGRFLACPTQGSLQSLKDRHAAGSQRFQTVGGGKGTRQLFSQPPKPRFRQVAYESPPSRFLYELREPDRGASLAVWPLAGASRLVVSLRNGAVARLRGGLPGRDHDIERFLVGRKPDGSDEAPTSLRVKIVPLASIGHPNADHGIRRILVEVPAGSPLRADDINWAFSGMELADPDTGEVLPQVLTPAEDATMLHHHGAGDGRVFRRWRTVTPAALPQEVARRRIDPARKAEQAKAGGERSDEEARAGAAMAQALRHAGVRARPDAIRVQREPFEAKGERVEAFASGTRFAKERLWHVEIAFATPVSGPLAVGDGRFLGLGVMAPIREVPGVYSFAVEDGLLPGTQPIELARALRRAVMARVQEAVGPRVSRLPAFFAGHEVDGSPARREEHPHLLFVHDPVGRRLLVIAPHVVEKRAASWEESQHLQTLDKALEGFRELRAGAAGCLRLRPMPVAADADPLFRPSRTWETLTRYQVTRHAKCVDAFEAFSWDLRQECLRRGLPEPHVTALETRGVKGLGLVGRARLAFKVAIPGPVILGRDRHVGGGLFRPAD